MNTRVVTRVQENADDTDAPLRFEFLRGRKGRLFNAQAQSASAHPDMGGGESQGMTKDSMEDPSLVQHGASYPSIHIKEEVS